MAVIRRINAQQTIDIGGIPSTQVDDGVGRGLQRLGAAVSDHSEVMHRLEMARIEQNQRIDEFATNQAFLRLGDDMNAAFAETQANIDPSGKGFTETVSGIFNKRAETFLQSVPDFLKPKFSELLATSRNQWVDKAAAAEVDQRNTWYRSSIVERAEVLQSQVFSDPTMFDAAKEDAFRAIDASGLPPVEKEELKKKVEETFSLAVAEREIREAEADPSKAAGVARRLGLPLDKPTAYREAIAAIESRGSGDYAAVGPRHKTLGRPLGRYQIMEANIRPWSRKHLGFEITPEQFLANPQYQDAIFDGEFAGYVKKYGLEGAAQAWFGGAGAVGKTDRKDVFGTDVGGYGAKFLRELKRIEGGSPTDPRYASLSLSERLTIYDKVQAAAQRGETAIKAQQTALYNAEKGALELGIQTGEVVSVQQIMASNLTDAHKADLISALRSRRGDEIAIAEAVQAFQSGTLKVDPYSTEGKKTVDGLYSAIEKSVDTEILPAVTEEIVKQTGLVPQTVTNNLRRVMESTVPADVAEAAQWAQRISSINPAALGRREGGKELQQFADDFSYYVNKLNLSPEDAARRIIEKRDPDKVRDRKALEPLAKEFTKEMAEVDLASEFDDSFLGWRSNPELGFSPGQEAGLKAEFMAIAEDEFYRANGDADIAKNRALQTMKRLYGVTNMTGRKVVMKHPPERYWPDLSEGWFEDPLNYARTQLEADLKELYPDPDMSRVQLVTTPQTDAMVKRGEMPAYAVLYMDNDGVLQTLPGKLWRPDFEREKARIQELQEGNAQDKQRREDIARDKQEATRARFDREGSLDRFLDAAPLTGEIQ